MRLVEPARVFLLLSRPTSASQALGEPSGRYTAKEMGLRCYTVITFWRQFGGGKKLSWTQSWSNRHAYSCCSTYGWTPHPGKNKLWVGGRYTTESRLAASMLYRRLTFYDPDLAVKLRFGYELVERVYSCCATDTDPHRQAKLWVARTILLKRWATSFDAIPSHSGCVRIWRRAEFGYELVEPARVFLLQLFETHIGKPSSVRRTVCHY
jgi:hypothetical protein